MAIKINVPTRTAGGLDIPAGAIACFVQTIPANAFVVEMTFSIYLNEDAVKNKLEPVGDIVGIGLSHAKKYDAEAFSKLSQGKIETEAKAFIETFIGAGNGEIITRDLLQPNK